MNERDLTNQKKASSAGADSKYIRVEKAKWQKSVNVAGVEKVDRCEGGGSGGIRKWRQALRPETSP